MAYKIIDKEQTDSVNKKSSLNVAFHPIEPEWTLDDVVFPVSLKEQLQDIVAFCKNRDKIIKEWELYRFLKGSGGCVGINLWGLPGTGKTIAAEALAGALGKRLIQASYATLMDSLQGNTEKNITALFDNAVEQDCVILFDEADGLLSARKTAGANSDSSNLIKSHMLNILDRSNAIVVFTTNFFKSYDRAFVRRILWNIEVPAPGIPELTQIWALHLGKMIPKDISYEELAQISFLLGEKKNMKITGGDVKKLTLMLCTRLTSGRIKSISREVIEPIFEKYLDDLQESEPIKEKDVAEHDLPKPVKELLKD